MFEFFDFSSVVRFHDHRTAPEMSEKKMRYHFPFVLPNSFGQNVRMRRPESPCNSRFSDYRLLASPSIASQSDSVQTCILDLSVVSLSNHVDIASNSPTLPDASESAPTTTSPSHRNPCLPPISYMTRARREISFSMSSPLNFSLFPGNTQRRIDRLPSRSGWTSFLVSLLFTLLYFIALLLRAP
jgi:hypothetical protein